jgi:hypothetical protein
MMMMQVGGTATIGETAEKMLPKSVLLSDTFWATHSRAAANGVTDAPEKGGVVACTEGPGPVASVTMLMLTCSWGPGALMGVQMNLFCLLCQQQKVKMKDQVSPRSQRVRAQLKADMDGPEAQIRLHMGSQVSSCLQCVHTQLKADIDGPGALMRLHMGGQLSSRSQLVRAQLKADMDGPGALMRLHMGGQVTLIMWP